MWTLNTGHATGRILCSVVEELKCKELTHKYILMDISFEYWHPVNFQNKLKIAKISRKLVDFGGTYGD